MKADATPETPQDRSHKPAADGSAKWIPWSMGCGFTKRLAPRMDLMVWKSDNREKGFQWSCFGANGKKDFPTIEKAQQVAESYARKILTEALASLPNMPLSGLDGERK